MRSRLAVVGCLLVVWLALATPARAWTEASIESASAHVDVVGERARVSLELGLRVDGGWLTRLSLRGLEPDLVLDSEKPPYIVCEDGRELLPTVGRDKTGQLVIGFPDAHAAPRRGHHRLLLAYEAALGTAGAAGAAPTALWSLPAFVSDLREAHVVLRAPPGSTPVARAQDAPGNVEVDRDAGGVTIALHAQHVPRGVPLELAFARPAPLSTPEPHATSVAGPLAARTELALLTCAALALCALKRSGARRLAHEHGARALPLLPLPAGVRRAASLVLATAFVLGYPRAPGAALLALVPMVALWLDRGFVRAAGAPVPWPRGAALVVALGRARRARAARVLGAHAWLDATTPAGAALLASSYALVLARSVRTGAPDVWLELLLALTPLTFTATRLQLPRSRHDALITHLRASRALRSRRRTRAVRTQAAASPAAANALGPSHAAAAPASPSRPADAGPRAPDRAA